MGSCSCFTPSSSSYFHPSALPQLAPTHRQGRCLWQDHTGGHCEVCRLSAPPGPRDTWERGDRAGLESELQHGPPGATTAPDPPGPALLAHLARVVRGAEGAVPAGTHRVPDGLAGTQLHLICGTEGIRLHPGSSAPTPAQPQVRAGPNPSLLLSSSLSCPTAARTKGKAVPGSNSTSSFQCCREPRPPAPCGGLVSKLCPRDVAFNRCRSGPCCCTDSSPSQSLGTMQVTLHS